LGLLSIQLVLFFLLPRKASQVFFFLYFAFWRAAYDAGLGWVLTKQSKKKWIVKEVQRLGWLDEKRRPAVRNWIRKQLADKMGKDYSFDVRPKRPIEDAIFMSSLGASAGIQYMAPFPTSSRRHSCQVGAHFRSSGPEF